MGKYNVIDDKLSGAKNCTNVAGKGCDSTGSVPTAIPMVKSALKAAIKYAENGEATATLANSVQNRKQTEENGKKTYTNTVTHTITISKFGDDNGNSCSVKLNFKCEDCSGVTMKFYVNDQAVDNLSSINCYSL